MNLRGGKLKKIFSTIVLLVIVVGGGYFIYTDYIKTKTPEEVAVNTGTMTVNDISDDEFDKLDKETQELAKQYAYNETFDSFDQLNEAKQEDESYLISKYDNQKLYLIMASKQKDGAVFAIFDDKIE